MFVPISRGVSRGTQLECVWFTVKKWGLASERVSSCMVPTHAPSCLSRRGPSPDCLGLNPHGDEWGQGMAPASWGVERA